MSNINKYDDLKADYRAITNGDRKALRRVITELHYLRQDVNELRHILRKTWEHCLISDDNVTVYKSYFSGVIHLLSDCNDEEEVKGIIDVCGRDDFESVPYDYNKNSRTLSVRSDDGDTGRYVVWYYVG